MLRTVGIVATAWLAKFLELGGGFISKDKPTIIQGINDAVIGMRVGGSRTIDCPPHLHWGRRGSGDGQIPPNTNLTIRINLLAVE